MVALGALWLPVIVSAAVVFVASALVWMALPHHRSDFQHLPDEEAARQTLRTTAPGVYAIPYCADSSAMKDPAFQAKMVEGPVGFLTLRRPGPATMGPQLVQSFLFYVVVSFFVAYVASHALAPGAHYLGVFQIVGTVAWMAYGFAVVTDSIWFGRPWSHTVKCLFDGLLYALLTAGVFGWLWPA
jgi:hypothetical protein